MTEHGGTMTAEPLASLAEIAPDSWLVGGAVRDRLLHRPTSDFDVALAGDVEAVARALARRAGGHAFLLSAQFGAWRVVSNRDGWQLDVLPLAGSVEADLGARDLTINAIAERVGGGEAVDPFGGMRDLRDGVLRVVSPHAFERDPLRTLRMIRLGCELGFRPEQGSLRLAARSAGGLAAVAPERLFAEFSRILVSPRALEGISLMDRLGLTHHVLPELDELRGVEQSGYHHLDVHGHTLGVLEETIRIGDDPSAVFAGGAERLRSVLAEPLADGLTRGQALRLGAIFHDIAKPQTRGTREDGRITFIGHDSAGAELAVAALGRLRASVRLRNHVAALTRHHLRLGFLVHRVPLAPRDVYGYLRASSPVEVDVTVLSVADRLATRGKGSEVAIARHLDLARRLLPAALDWRESPPRPPLPGDELARELQLSPGPELGRILAELEQASYAGEIAGHGEAIALARRIADAGPSSLNPAATPPHTV